VGHLLDLGHRDIRHIAGPPGSMDAEERMRGWRDRLAEEGLPVPEAQFGDWSPESGYRIGRALLAAGRPQAVFVSNDQMAMGLYHALDDAGMRVPHDVSVVGFDDIPEAGHFLPPLTTMRQDFEALGRDAMSAVLVMLQDEESDAPVPSRVPELIVRSSTRKA